MNTRKIPQFESEAEEANWWYDNREAPAQDVVQAIENGTTGEGSLGRWARRQEELHDKATSNPQRTDLGSAA